MVKTCYTFLLITCCFLTAWGQELNCRIQVNADRIGGTDKVVYEQFKNAVTEFLNNRQWSSAPMARNERIDCNMMFIFQQTEGSHHQVELQVQSRRPVFNSNYQTSMLNVRQLIEFDYLENQPLEFNASQLDNNLTATLAFWVYIILGMDFDSFSLYGGEPFFTMAQEIVSQAQGVLGDNWKSHSDEKNCWDWINALTSENRQAMRKWNYTYHRQAMDRMYDNMEQARATILESLKVLEEEKRIDARSPLLSNLSDTKLDEWIQLYAKAPTEEKTQVLDLLNFVYPGQSNRLQAINQP